MSFIVISDPACFNGEYQLINQLFEAGMPHFHLRKPGVGKDHCAKLISRIDPRYHERIALHQFHEMVKDFPLITRLHYPEKHRKNNDSYNRNYTLSTSIHSLNELDKLSHFDYTFFGPVFNSLSKPGYSGLTSTELLLPRSNNRIKIIALGGIEENKIEKVKHFGFDGLAILGGIWNDKKQVLSNFKKLINKYNESFN